MNANIKGRSTLAEFPDGTRVLHGEIEIDCPSCGTGIIHIPGHHMKIIRNLLISWCDEHPELVGQDENIKEVGRTRIAGTPPARPENN